MEERISLEKNFSGTSLAIQWLRLRHPMVKTSPSNAGGMGLIPGWKLSSHMPCGKKKNPNMKNRNNIVTSSTKTLKMVHIKKKKS